jgi:hypothetical protein
MRFIGIASTRWMAGRDAGAWKEARDDDPRRHAVGIDRAAHLPIAPSVAVESEAATGRAARGSTRHARARSGLLHLGRR